MNELSAETAAFFMKAPDNNVLEFALARRVLLVEEDAEFILILHHGARAVTSAEAVTGVDMVIVKIAPLFANVPACTVIIDTSNYYPKHDGEIPDIEAGKTESEWVDRPVAKACSTAPA